MKFAVHYLNGQVSPIRGKQASQDARRRCDPQSYRCSPTPKSCPLPRYGRQQLKNITRPVRAFAVRAERHLSASDKPANPVPLISLVVLPFTNLSADPEQEYFADAITDDLTTDLSRTADSFVIARSTAFTYKGKAVDVRQVARELGVRYVLEGSVRRMGDRVQVNVQLIDGFTGSHVWADRFDTDHSDLAAAQSHITARIAGTLYIELVTDIGRRIEHERVADPHPRDLVMRARALSIQMSPSNTGARAGIIELLERALILDPSSVDARVLLAGILVADIADGLSRAVEQDEARAEPLIGEALERNPNHSGARRVMGQLRRVQGRWAESQVELETAIALDPNNSSAIRQLGLTLLIQGRPEAALPHFERATRLEVRKRHVFNGYANLGRCQLFLGRIDEAVESFRRARTLAPGIWYVHLELAAALGLRGQARREFNCTMARHRGDARIRSSAIAGATRKDQLCRAAPCRFPRRMSSRQIRAASDR